MWAIVGLGNPGLKYKWNRHNIGFHIIDLLAKIYDIKLKQDRLMPAVVGKGRIDEKEIILFKPTTYMNRSGLAVKGLQDIYGIQSKDILVVSDDIDLPWNKIRIRHNGSSGGHNGLKSIIEALSTTNFPRVRMGVGRPVNSSGEVIGHVLSNFSAEEKKDLNKYCELVAEAVFVILSSGIDAAMNKFN
jgi:PTH1 family peptidyl-tRNA hydrolase